MGNGRKVHSLPFSLVQVKELIRNPRRLARDRPRFPSAPPAAASSVPPSAIPHAPTPDALEAVKFICKDVWIALYDKQIDNLRTNHRGVYVLVDNAFKPLARVSGAGEDDEVGRMVRFVSTPREGDGEKWGEKRDADPGSSHNSVPCVPVRHHSRCTSDFGHLVYRHRRVGCCSPKCAPPCEHRFPTISLTQPFVQVLFRLRRSSLVLCNTWLESYSQILPNPTRLGPGMVHFLSPATLAS